MGSIKKFLSDYRKAQKIEQMRPEISKIKEARKALSPILKF